MQRTVEVLSEEYARAHEKPIDHAAYLSTQILSRRFWDVDHRHECLRSLTFEDFTKFVANLFSKVSATYHKVFMFTLVLYFSCQFEGMPLVGPLVYCNSYICTSPVQWYLIQITCVAATKKFRLTWLD